MTLLLHSNNDEAIKIARRLHSFVELTVFANVSKVTIFLGVTSFSNDDSFDTALGPMDKALYLAREQGRNRVVDQ